jgi:hypothetical protein
VKLVAESGKNDELADRAGELKCLFPIGMKPIQSEHTISGWNISAIMTYRTRPGRRLGLNQSVAASGLASQSKT